MIRFLSQGILLGIYAGVSPGPLQTLHFSLALKNGWRKTIYLVLTPLLSDLPILVLFMTMFSQVSENILMGVRLVGGIVILFLAYSTFKSFSLDQSANQEDVFDLSEESKIKMLGKLTMLNWVNPNVFIFWGTIGAPLALEGLAISVWHMVIFIAAFYLLLMTMLGVMIIIFSKSQLLSPNFQKGLGIGLALLLCLMGAYNIFQAVQFFFL